METFYSLWFFVVKNGGLVYYCLCEMSSQLISCKIAPHLRGVGESFYLMKALELAELFVHTKSLSPGILMELAFASCNTLPSLFFGDFLFFVLLLSQRIFFLFFLCVETQVVSY